MESYAQAVREAGSFDTDDVIAAWEDITFEAAHGTLDFAKRDEQWPHDPKYGEDLLIQPILQWQEVDGEGQPVGLWPEKVRRGEFQRPPWVS
jgi:branched-chain amino acid transport system substrate-binding protein